MCVLYIHKVNIVDAVFLVVVIVKLPILSYMLVNGGLLLRHTMQNASILIKLN